MNAATEISDPAERTRRELDNPALHDLVRGVGIPARPTLLVELQDELAREAPSMHRIADIVGSDVALSAALLRTANSPLMGLTRRVETVEQAFLLLGEQHCLAIFTEIVLRRLLPSNGPVLTRFWDVSGKRARAMTYLARAKRLVAPALAHTYGLFMDVGIPLLAQRFRGPGNFSYFATLARANAASGITVPPTTFTSIEQAAHGTDHTLVGALAARSWCVSQTAVLAVRLHHEYAAWGGPMPPQVPELLALGLASERIIQRYAGQNRHQEWERGGVAAMRVLGIDEPTFDDWCAEVHEQFRVTGV
jgi:HD-like signal output (HDOD) protein